MKKALGKINFRRALVGAVMRGGGRLYDNRRKKNTCPAIRRNTCGIYYSMQYILRFV